MEVLIGLLTATATAPTASVPPHCLTASIKFVDKVEELQQAETNGKATGSAPTLSNGCPRGGTQHSHQRHERPKLEKSLIISTVSDCARLALM